ncbi:TPA: recombinase family protein [Vibrio parahaemolyticus]|uniref:recombinase family protein n=1 Tax=Vibrio harveyi group TaxID=717610 RepID=UPI0013027C2A|nr:recombinase family protein [Vibrio parahaemolyticus]MDF4376508.1 recombinase family protein [Vibrio parahaemolyticus]HCE2818027.1 recombinase family protein [Vibrio parahaemolyticus]HCE2912705.1 recombinase family protein [Vibrio parahaemolyticus]HCE3621002.1 recombinase family protein [Vibrio parahaemolyticus]HCG5306688.1 recombinase family protein [Vibrio parahaemolyticus]
MRLAYSYIRFSSLEQAKGDSFRRQTALAKDYCDKHGLKLADLTLRDLGKSAYHGTHFKDGALGEFINAVKEGTIPAGSYLLVESMDRLSREKISIALGRFMELLGLGISIVTLQDNRTYTTQSLDRIEDLMLSLVFMMRAHEESATKSKRLREAHKEKRKQARENLKPTGYNTPHWIELTESGYELIPDRVELLKRIFQMTIDGLGAIAIHKQLNQEAIKPWGRSKTGWHTTYIKKILRARTVLGEYQPFKTENGKRVKDGEPIQGYYPEAIDVDTFKRANLAIESRQGKTSGTRKNVINNLFTGLVVCKNCGATMHYLNKGSGSKGGQYLVCSRARQGAHHDGIFCKYASMRYPIVEEAILTIAATLNLKLHTASSQEESAYIKEQLSDLSRNLKTVEASILRLVDLLDSSTGSKALLTKLEQREAQQQELEQRYRELEKRLDEIELTPKSNNVWKELKHTLKTLKVEAADRTNVTLRSKVNSQLSKCVDSIEFDAISKLVTINIDESREVLIKFDMRQDSYVIKPSWDMREFLPATYTVKEALRKR